MASRVAWADLVRCRRAYPEVDPDRAASLLGLDRGGLPDSTGIPGAAAEGLGASNHRPSLPVPESRVPARPDFSGMRMIAAAAGSGSKPPPEPPAADVGSWPAPVRFESDPMTVRTKTPEWMNGPAWRAGPAEPAPPVVPLLAWRHLASPLHRAIGVRRPTREPDCLRVLEILSRGRPLEILPMLYRRQWPARCRVLIQIDRHLIHLRQDRGHLLAWLRRVLGPQRMGIEWVRTEDCSTPQRMGIEWVRTEDCSTPQRMGREWVRTEDCSTPPAYRDTAVLLLGDAGVLLGSDQREAWARLGRKLRRRGCGTTVLMPCWPEAAGALRRAWRPLVWDRPRTGAVQIDGERLLAMTLPLLVATPALLRDLRRKCLALGFRAPAEVECAAWSHPAAGWPSSESLEIEPQQLHPLSEVLGRMLQANPGLAPAIETVCCQHARDDLDRAAARLILALVKLKKMGKEEGEKARAADEAKKAAADLGPLAVACHNGDHQPFFGWIASLLNRVAAFGVVDVWKRCPQLAALWALCLDRERRPAPQGLEREGVAWALGDSAVESRVLWQAGRDLRLLPLGRQPGRPPLSAGSPLAPFRAVGGCLTIHRQGVHPVLLAGEDAGLPIPEGEWTVRDADGRLVMGDLLRPPWAERLERDEFGLCALLRLPKGPSMNLRWIPPGRFLMGSSEKEPGRWSGEGPQHWVAITRGFWLAETPCTQVFWEAVMGKNPSQFEGCDRPVEQVSWDDVQVFFPRLNGLASGLGSRLPTEAEWEYACRAGTTSAFNDGSPCTQPEGQDPALDKLGWYDKNSGNETHPVKMKRPNAWGLFDMHGNVWEWCQDRSGSYEAKDQEDPEGPPSGANRVLRGGGGWGVARYCRSACRNGYDPGNRWYYQGFRFAAVQPRG